eukprot:gene40556-59112_t
MVTDGDNIAWMTSPLNAHHQWPEAGYGNFVAPDHGWWGSALRGRIPVAWTAPPLAPHFLRYLSDTATPNDTLISGPSGAAYTYIDQYPSAAARGAFGRWTADALAAAGRATAGAFADVVNMIQWGAYDADVLDGVVCRSAPPSALLIDEYTRLTLNGTLAAVLNAAPRDPSAAHGYSVAAIEAWRFDCNVSSPGGT